MANGGRARKRKTPASKVGEGGSLKPGYEGIGGTTEALIRMYFSLLHTLNTLFFRQNHLIFVEFTATLLRFRVMEKSGFEKGANRRGSNHSVSMQ